MKKISKNIKLPELPKTIYPLFYEKGKKAMLIFGIDKEKNYTIVWDYISKYPIDIYWKNKHEDDEYEIERLKCEHV